MDIEQDQITQAIRNCEWRRCMQSVDVCAIEVAPCMKVIDKGKCEAMKKLFSSEVEHD